MASPRSPFIVIEQFISPKLCEQLVYSLDVTVPDTDPEGHPLKVTRTDENNALFLYERLLPLFPKLEEYYGFTYKGTEGVVFEWFPEGSTGEFVCENSSYRKGKWFRTKQRDLSAVLFLSDYQDQVPFERDFEVYGGKLEFPQHGFGFNPKRGTIIFYPSVPHFINVTTPIYVGELYQARIQIAAQQPLLYDPRKFPGTYKDWF